MHELSIAMSIVEICTEEAKKAKAEKLGIPIISEDDFLEMLN